MNQTETVSSHDGTPWFKFPWVPRDSIPTNLLFEAYPLCRTSGEGGCHRVRMRVSGRHSGEHSTSIQPTDGHTHCLDRFPGPVFHSDYRAFLLTCRGNSDPMHETSPDSL